MDELADTWPVRLPSAAARLTNARTENSAGRRAKAPGHLSRGHRADYERRERLRRRITSSFIFREGLPPFFPLSVRRFRFLIAALCLLMNAVDPRNGVTCPSIIYLPQRVFLGRVSIKVGGLTHGSRSASARISRAAIASRSLNRKRRVYARAAG